jgi:hypothetical protein
MQHIRSFGRGLFPDPAAVIVKGQDPAMNDVNTLTAPSLPYKFLFSCQRDEGLNRIRLDEGANDFFATEDLLSQVYEDAVHGAAMAE